MAFYTNLTRFLNQNVSNYTEDDNLDIEVQTLFETVINSEAFKLIIGSIWMFLFLFGTIGNGLIIFIAIKYRKLNDITNCYIFNLAITDILFSLHCIPFTTFIYLNDNWIFGNILCKLSHFFSRASVQITCLTLTVMTIHRCNIIIKSKTTAKQSSRIGNKKKIVIVNTALVWIVSLLVSTPDIFFYKTIRESSDNITITHCKLVKEALYWYKLTNLVAVITAYTLPLLVIVLSYARLLSFLSSNQKRLAKFENKRCLASTTITNTTLNSNTKEEGSTNNQPLLNNKATTADKAKNKTKRVTKMVAIITLNFGICWFPTQILVLLRQFDPRFPYGSSGFNVIYLLKIIAHTLTYVTPVLNPCLYGFYNENFRTPLIQMYQKIKAACKKR